MNYRARVRLNARCWFYAGSVAKFAFGIAAEVSGEMPRCCMTSPGGMCVTQSFGDNSR